MPPALIAIQIEWAANVGVEVGEGVCELGPLRKQHLEWGGLRWYS